MNQSEQFVQAYKDGQSVMEICAEHGVSASHVYRGFRKEGFTVNPAKRADSAQVMIDYKSGITKAEIARRNEVSRQAVTTMVNKRLKAEQDAERESRAGTDA